MTRSLLAPALFGLAVMGCSSVGNTLDNFAASDDINSGACPNVFVLKDAASAIDFAGEPSLDTVAWTAEIQDIRTNCRYSGDRPIEAVVEIDFAVGKGPAANGEIKDLEYFVAVTRRNRDLIAKEEFTVPVRIRGDVATATLTEKVTNIEIPRLSEQVSGTNFEIAVGISLTRDQVLYNRSGDSLKFPEL